MYPTSDRDMRVQTKASCRIGPVGPEFRAERWWKPWRVRALLLSLLVLALGWLSNTTAAADPVDPADVPANLRQYVPDSAEWAASPWMTGESCRDQGGDWSTYAAFMIQDFPALLEFFQPDFANDDGNAPERKKLLVRGYNDLAANLTAPTGYCVEQVKSWAKANPDYQPFGFEWGNVDTMGDHGVRPWSNCSTTSPGDLAPCRGFYIACDGAITQQEDQRCQAWNTFSDDYVTRMNTVLRKAYTQYPLLVDGSDQTKTCYGCKSPAEVAQEFLNWVAKKGMEQVVSFIVSGVTKLWGTFMRIATDFSSPQVTGVAFASVYNLVAGVALALAFLGWLVTLASSWRRGHLQYSLFGGIKAAVGVTLAGVGAILMLQLAHDCTKALISAGGDIAQQADFTTSLAKANPLVAIIAGALIGISLIFAIIFLIVDAALVLMWTLFGAFAAAGQVHQATSGWVWKWAARGTAMAWAPFFMVAVMLLSQALLLPLDAGEDPVEQVVDVVQGLALCLLLVLCPWLLWELVDFVGDRIGGPAASGGVAGRAASTGSQRGVTATGGAAGAAVRTMASAAREFGRGFAEGPQGRSDGGSSSGGNSGRSAVPVPRPEPNQRASTGNGSEGSSAREGATGGDGAEGNTAAQSPVSMRSGGGGSDGVPGTSPPANLGRVVASAPPRQPTPTAPAEAAGPPEASASSGSGGRGDTRMPPPAD